MPEEKRRNEKVKVATGWAVLPSSMPNKSCELVGTYITAITLFVVVSYT